MADKKESKELITSGFLEPFEEMERWFDNLLRSRFYASPSFRHEIGIPFIEEVSPLFDIYEEGNDVVVKGEVPGMKKEDLTIQLTEEAITISGEKKKEEKIEKKNYYRYERSCGSFSRTFHLPKGIQIDQAKARLKEGVLEIRIPRTEKVMEKVKKLEIE